MPGTVPGERGGTFQKAALADGSRLVITTQGGARVVGTDDGGVSVDGTTLARWGGDGSTHTLDLPCDQGDDRARDNCGGMPLIRVPSGVTLTVRAHDAGIDVSDVRGELSLSTVNGDVTVRDSGTKGARQHLVTRNGSVRATGLAAREVGAGLTELPGQLKGSGGRGMAKGVLSGAAEAMSDAFHQARDEGRSRRG